MSNLLAALQGLENNAERRLDRDRLRRQAENERFRATLGAINEGADTAVRGLGTVLSAQEARQAREEDVNFRLSRALAGDRQDAAILKQNQEKIEQDQIDSQARAQREADAQERQFEQDAINKASTQASTQATLAGVERQAAETRRGDETRTAISDVLKLRGNPVAASGPLAPERLDAATASKEAQMTAGKPDAWAWLKRQDIAERKMDVQEAPKDSRGPNVTALLNQFKELEKPPPRSKELQERLDSYLPDEELSPEDADALEKENTEQQEYRQRQEEYVLKGGLAAKMGPAPDSTTPPNPAVSARSQGAPVTPDAKLQNAIKRAIQELVAQGRTPQEAEAEVMADLQEARTP